MNCSFCCSTAAARRSHPPRSRRSLLVECISIIAVVYYGHCPNFFLDAAELRPHNDNFTNKSQPLARSAKKPAPYLLHYASRTQTPPHSVRSQVKTHWNVCESKLHSRVRDALEDSPPLGTQRAAQAPEWRRAYTVTPSPPWSTAALQE